jgi:adenylate cyclase
MERKLAAIFSTDVAGYSRLMGDDEEATIRTLTASRAVISSLIHLFSFVACTVRTNGGG